MDPSAPTVPVQQVPLKKNNDCYSRLNEQRTNEANLNNEPPVFKKRVGATSRGRYRELQQQHYSHVFLEPFRFQTNNNKKKCFILIQVLHNFVESVLLNAKYLKHLKAWPLKTAFCIVPNV